MKEQYSIHPDFKHLAKIHPPLDRFSVTMVQKLMGGLFLGQRNTQQVTLRRFQIPTDDGQRIRALLFEPANVHGQTGCVLYCHGGGFVFPAAPHMYELARTYAQQAGVRVLMVDYRLAPKYPFPTAALDCFAAYRWLLDRSEKLQIDPAKIVVCGDSAGGHLSIAICLMARQSNMMMPCGQLLTYPTVGNCGVTESMERFMDTPMCSTHDMERYGQMYDPDKTKGP